MRLYYINEVGSNEARFFTVYERTTGHILSFHVFYDDAFKVANFMDRGGAFFGFTPRFILKEVPVNKFKKKDINDNFKKLDK